MSERAVYYAQLEAGAQYLADKASDPAERETHLEMARVYRERSLDAAPSPRRQTVH